MINNSSISDFVAEGSCQPPGLMLSPARTPSAGLCPPHLCPPSGSLWQMCAACVYVSRAPNTPVGTQGWVGGSGGEGEPSGTLDPSCTLGYPWDVGGGQEQKP